jgi:hypothetical protein
MMMKNTIRIGFAAGLALLLAACASGGATKSSASAKAAAGVAVETRAAQRWQHLIEGRTDAAYEYLTPGARSTKTREEWAKEMAQRPIKWTKADYLDKACDSDDACLVRLQIEYKAPLQGAPGGLMAAPGILTERWIRIDGIWYFLPESLVSGGLH